MHIIHGVRSASMRSIRFRLHRWVEVADDPAGHCSQLSRGDRIVALRAAEVAQQTLGPFEALGWIIGRRDYVCYRDVQHEPFLIALEKRLPVLDLCADGFSKRWGRAPPANRRSVRQKRGEFVDEVERVLDLVREASVLLAKRCYILGPEQVSAGGFLASGAPAPGPSERPARSTAEQAMTTSGLLGRVMRQAMGSA